MSKKTIQISFTVTAELEVEEAVLAVALTDGWRDTFYNFTSEYEVGHHIACNLLRNADLTQLDGWADRDDGDAILRNVDWEID